VLNPSAFLLRKIDTAIAVSNKKLFAIIDTLNHSIDLPDMKVMYFRKIQMVAQITAILKAKDRILAVH
jgi:hypothetical protein